MRICVLSSVTGVLTWTSCSFPLTQPDVCICGNRFLHQTPCYGLELHTREQVLWIRQHTSLVFMLYRSNFKANVCSCKLYMDWWTNTYWTVPIETWAVIYLAVWLWPIFLIIIYGEPFDLKYRALILEIILEIKNVRHTFLWLVNESEVIQWLFCYV